MSKRIRFITSVNNQEEANRVAAGLKLVKGCRHVTICPDVYGLPCQVRSYWMYSPALARQDGAVVVE